jgi:hypothetical protein
VKLLFDEELAAALDRIRNAPVALQASAAAGGSGILPRDG